MRAFEGFLIGLVAGGLLAVAWLASGPPAVPVNPDDTFRPPVAASDTSCACCEEYLDHIARDHSRGAR